MKPIIPFEPTTADLIPKGDDWIAQLKWDGTRILTYFENGELQLFNRKLNERTKQYPELQDPSEYCKASSLILDGEVISFKDGKPSFYDVMKRDRLRKFNHLQKAIEETPIVYMVFDVLFFDGEWVLDRTLRERQALLEDIMLPHASVQVVESFADKEGLYQACLQSGLEGVVFKDLNSRYTLNGKDSRWRKMKKEYDLIAVVGGVTYRGDIVSSLDLGLYNDQNELIYIGSAGSGKLSYKDWKDVTTAIQQIITDQSPFVNLKQHENAHHTWISPALKIKVTYLEWTQTNTLRHPVIQSFV
ncbi:ATP-dependent DNA ligase [Cytobacillus purgationiresistens]|uniref:DNA ligase (ATP) n=1 Tax=Cytobacillus purgationiresistens TaxID=863449 RepID=A0ABU0AGW7_9BACI|nr:RNA ligase family protein [Cytobacillus purgationiresistens]MDQ0270482.1 bifunctional non-homologous end joining protein LigD [Cytobacillus purgationiresistens]